MERPVQQEYINSDKLSHLSAEKLKEILVNAFNESLNVINSSAETQNNTPVTANDLGSSSTSNDVEEVVNKDQQVQANNQQEQEEQGKNLNEKITQNDNRDDKLPSKTVLEILTAGKNQLIIILGIMCCLGWAARDDNGEIFSHTHPNIKDPNVFDTINEIISSITFKGDEKGITFDERETIQDTIDLLQSLNLTSWKLNPEVPWQDQSVVQVLASGVLIVLYKALVEGNKFNNVDLFIKILSTYNGFHGQIPDPSDKLQMLFWKLEQPLQKNSDISLFINFLVDKNEDFARFFLAFGSNFLKSISKLQDKSSNSKSIDSGADKGPKTYGYDFIVNPIVNIVQVLNSICQIANILKNANRR